MMITLSNSDFDDNGNLKTPSLQDKKVMVLFYADYCPACRGFKPTFEESSNDLKNDPQIVFARISTPENRDLMFRMNGRFPFEVKYIPTVVSYNNGKYYSTYDYDSNNPHERSSYRTKPDVIEYARGIGTAERKYKS